MADEKITELDAKATPADTDLVPVVDIVADPDQTKKVTWANVKATLKTYFDTLYALLAHKDRHDPEDGADPLDTAAPSELASVQAAGAGSSHSLARADHQHQIQHGINDNHLVTVDGTINNGEYLKATASGAEGKTFAEVVTDILSSFADQITGAHLSQTFGAGGGRLLRYVPTPISNYFLAVANVGADDPFTGDIDDNAGAHGGQGLDATHVPYDGDANENMFEGLYAYDGSTYWGQIVLHNTTRSNSRKIVSVDRTNNVIVTTSSTDDWADGDALTTVSPTIGQTTFFDIDLSDFVTATMAAINISVYLSDVSAGATSGRRIELHPFVTYDAGKKIQSYNSLASQQSFISYIIPVISQKVCLKFVSHSDTFMTYRVSGYWEYADT